MGKMGNLDQMFQIYAILYLMVHSKDICEMLSFVIGYNWQINATFKFSQKLLFEENLAIQVQLGPRLLNLISHPLMRGFFLKIFIMMQNKQTKLILDYFHKNFPLGKMSKGFVNPVFTF